MAHADNQKAWPAWTGESNRSLEGFVAGFRDAIRGRSLVDAFGKDAIATDDVRDAVIEVCRSWAIKCKSNEETPPAP
jgi:hypothetical protein